MVRIRGPLASLLRAFLPLKTPPILYRGLQIYSLLALELHIAFCEASYDLAGLWGYLDAQCEEGRFNWWVALPLIVAIQCSLCLDQMSK